MSDADRRSQQRDIGLGEACLGNDDVGWFDGTVWAANSTQQQWQRTTHGKREIRRFGWISQPFQRISVRVSML